MHSLVVRQGMGRGVVTAAFTTLLSASMALAGAGAAAAQDDSASGPTSVVVTTEMLGAIVTDLVGDAAEVTVLMEGGTNPHTFEASARDSEAMLHADLIVSNGLGLEEGLLPMLEVAESEGVSLFAAADHVELLDLESADDEDDHEHDREAGLGSEDPHIWTDPLAMRDVVVALGPALAEVGIDVADNATILVAQLEALDAEVVEILSAVPEERRKLVTGHRSMGYFADRYGFEQIGTVIPSLSTSGEPTARELAQLISDIREHDVTTVFAEVGTPQSVARAVAGDSGATLVELSAAKLPEDGTFATFIRDLATTIADALGG